MPVPPTGGKLFGFSTGLWRETQEPRFSAADQAQLAAVAGSNAQRVLFDWQWAERTRDVVDLRVYRELYDELLARGIRPVFTLANAPPWARDPLDTLLGGGCPVATGCNYPPGPGFLDEWREIAATLATEFPQAAAIEIWNEPNLDAFWDPEPDPQRFVEIQREAYQAIKAVKPAMTVLAGGLNNFEGGDDTGIAMRTFLHEAYQAGLRTAMDAISFHPYPWSTHFGSGTLFARSFDAVRSVARANGDAGRELWVTEVGLSTVLVSEADQADALKRLYARLMTMSDVKAVFVHELVDRPWTQGENPGYGVLRRGSPPTPAPKPAFCRFAVAAGSQYPGC